MLFTLIALSLVFAFINGYRDSSSILAGVFASRAVPPRTALVVTSLAEFVAPFLVGSAVARTLATGLVDPKVISLETITTGIGGAIVWTLFAWYQGIPSSSSHALVGGLMGAALLIHGPSSLILSGLVRVVLPLFLAPLIGLGVGYLVMRIILYLFRNATPRANLLFQRLQFLTMVGLALSHSANDAQKSIGIITLGLVLSGSIPTFQIPLLVVVLCAGAIALGASRGDWRLIRTLGGRIYNIRPINALASQGASTTVVMVSALIGAPVSTSQVISMAILGSGAAERMNKVRWQVGGSMLITWLLTIPMSMLIATSIFTAVRVISWLLSGANLQPAG